jgi:hypothetical protein
MEPHNELLLRILHQAVRDYMKLDPDSDSSTAEFFENEGADYKTAEDFIYNGTEFMFGTVVFNYDTLCNYLGINPRKLRKRIAKEATEY